MHERFATFCIKDVDFVQSTDDDEEQSDLLFGVGDGFFVERKRALEKFIRDGLQVCHRCELCGF